jgi:NitT/TauT family transport system substrate-binding protein
LATTRQAEPELKIAVNSTTIESFPVFAAVDAGLSARVQLIPTTNGRTAMAQLVSGAADAATGSETQALLNSVADPRIRIALTLAECRYRIVARRSAGLRATADLRGKTVAATSNTSSQYFLTRMLEKARLSESDVRYVSLEGPDMPAALKEGRVDAVAIWEPHAQNAQEALGSDAIILQDPAAYTERFNLNTRTDVLQNPRKRAALVALVQEIDRVSVRLRKQPESLIPTLSPKVALSERMVKAVWPQFSFPASLSGGLARFLVEVEPWVAASQKRQPRTERALAVLIDNSLRNAASR